MKTNIDQLAEKIWYLKRNKTIMIPTLGDYPAYDDLDYAIMDRDHVRNRAYNNVIRQKVKGKTVVEIGPGARLLMTRMCVEAGASKVYAIEADEAVYRKTKAFAVELGLADKIEVIHGFSVDIELPEKVDVCLSEIIGSIGDSEGAARYLSDAKRFLKPSGIMIPEGCSTLISPVFKPTEIHHDPLIDEMIQEKIETTYEKLGHEFSFTRYEVFNFPASHLISPPQIFEEYWFDEPVVSEVLDRHLLFTVQHNRPFDGVLLWIHLYVDREEVIDSFSGSCWEPVYISMPSFEVNSGDTLELHCHSELSRNRFNPDYTFEAVVTRQGQVVYRHKSEATYE